MNDLLQPEEISQNQFRCKTLTEKISESTPKYELEPSDTTHNQGRHTVQIGLQSETGTHWSSQQLQKQAI